MVLLILAFLIMLAIDIFPLLRAKNKRELVIYCVLFVVTFTLCAMHTSGVFIPSPLVLLTDAAMSIGIHY